MSKIRVSIIGGGNMGAAIIDRIRRRYAVTVCESNKARARLLARKYKVRLADIESAVACSRIILLAVKPQDFDKILSQIKKTDLKGKIIVSIAAGVSTLYIEKRLKQRAKVIRVMPNLPVQIGEGMSCLCAGKNAGPSDLKQAKRLFDEIGQTVIVKESQMDAVTAVSGSGPAYVFLFIECLMKASRALRLDQKISEALVRQTLKGSMSLWESSGKEARVLRQNVTSKGGTTQAAMDIFNKRKIERIFIQALRSARERSKNLSR